MDEENTTATIPPKDEETGDKKEVGTWVYMKRMKDEQWKGPGQVWGHLSTNISAKLEKKLRRWRHSAVPTAH